MATKPLGQRQLLAMGEENLTKRFSEYFQETDDALYMVQCALVVMVKNALCPADFSYFSKQLVRKVFMGEYDLFSVRELCVYFRNYFNDKEWSDVTTRLFPSKEEFAQLEKRTCGHLEKIHHLLYSGKRNVERKANLITTFEDAAGKKHSWTLSNVDPSLTPDEHEALLAILGTIDIFQKNGVRKFAKLVGAHYSLIQTSIDPQTLKEEAPETQQAKLTALPKVTALAQESPGEAKPVGDKEKRYHKQASSEHTNILEQKPVSTLQSSAEAPSANTDGLLQGLLSGMPLVESLKNQGSLENQFKDSTDQPEDGQPTNKKHEKVKSDFWNLVPGKKSWGRNRRKKR